MRSEWVGEEPTPSCAPQKRDQPSREIPTATNLEPTLATHAKAVAEIIAADEGYHMNFGWEALEWMTPKLDDEQRQVVAESLPEMFASFERICCGGPEALRELTGSEMTVEEDDEPNIGMLTDSQYAGIFYHCLEEEIIPRLEELGYDARAAWEKRLVTDE